MSIQYDDSLLDFDLEFLHQNTNKSLIPEKPPGRDERHRKPVSLVKKKIIATDTLIRKYYEKKEEVDQIERTLNTSKEEYKQTCIEFKNAVEKCTVTEQEAQTLRNINVELQQKYEHSQNIVGAIQSHVNQLQNLVKNNETTIESLTIESKLHKANAKDYEKKFVTMQKENEELMRHICLVRDIVFGKKKLNKHRKAILLKYNKQYESDDNDSLFGDQSSDNETDAENVSSKKDAMHIGRSDKDVIKGECVPLKDDHDHDSDCSNELASADTGRGSSLAFSDGEKCFNSPDYFVNHSPINPDIRVGQRKKLVSVATSPIPFAKTKHVATSPAHFDYENIQITLSPMSAGDIDDHTEIAMNTEFDDLGIIEISQPTIMERVQSNIVHLENLFNSTTEANLSEGPTLGRVFENDICIDEETTSTSPVIIAGSNFPMESNHTMETLKDKKDPDLNKSINFGSEDCVELSTSNNLSEKEYFESNTSKNISEKDCFEINNSNNRNEKECIEPDNSNDQIEDGYVELNNSNILSEKECLELNSSNNLDTCSTGDCEIEMILHRMRLHHTLITPIPNSPSKSTNAASTSSADSETSKKMDTNVCKDAEKIREDNLIFKAKLSELAQEILSIKDILRNKQLLDEGGLNNSNAVDTRKNCVAIQSSTQNIEHTVSKCVSPGTGISKRTPRKSHTVNQSKYKNNVSDIVFNKPYLTSPLYTAQKTHGKDESHKEIPVNGQTGNLINTVSNRCASKYAAKSVSDKPDFEDVLSRSSVTKTKDPVHTKLRNSSVHNYTHVSDKMNTSASNISIPDEVEEDSLPLSSMLVFESSDSLHTETTHNDIEKHEENSCNKFTDKLQSKNVKKHRKLTKLEKMRNNLLPKSKIRNTSTPLIKKLRVRPKQTPLLPKQVSAGDNAASLNNKDVYEKALKVMSELKSKERVKQINGSCPKPTKPKVKRDTTRNKSEKVLSQLDETSSCTNIEENMQDIEVATSQDGKEKALSNSNTFKKELVIAVAKCDDNSNVSPSPSPKKVIATRSRSKLEGINMSPIKNTIQTRNNEIQNNKQHEKSSEVSEVNKEVIQQGSRKRPKRASVDKSDIPCKRMLRSSTLRQSTSEEISTNSNNLSNSETDPAVNNSLEIIKGGKKEVVFNITTTPKETAKAKEILSYNDIDMFTGDKDVPSKQTHEEKGKQISPKDSILCGMLDKFGKDSTKKYTKNISDSVIASTSKLLQEELATISESNQNDTKKAMNGLVETIVDWGYRRFIAGLMAYLKDPQRKVELFNKINSPPAPPMTKSEQILLYIISQLRVCLPSVDIVGCTLRNIEYMLFKLNRTPEFEIIESCSHFYAVVCRYFNMKSRLRLFMLDAMYCIQFKAVPLIKQCLDVWMHVLPLAHMGIAKSPLVTCMVYLLHFYKCDDRFNRVQEIRNILNRKYFYEITEWNEPKIIEMFKNAINEIKALPIEMKLLRISLIVIAKRHGPRWCQNNIVKKLLLPRIESDVSPRVKAFCISLLGPLLKPYPVDMKVHCEIVMNKLLDILKQNPCHLIEEAVVTSLIYMSKHNYTRVLQTLLALKLQRVSPELEGLLQDFVAEKPLKAWKTVLSKIHIHSVNNNL